MASETAHTKRFCAELRRQGCIVQTIVGGLLQSGVPDRYVLTEAGRHTWLEMKVSSRVTPWPILRDAGTLLGRTPTGAKQDEFIRSVTGRDPNGAAVIVSHDNPLQWAVYVPTDRPNYQLLTTKRPDALRWVLTGRII